MKKLIYLSLITIITTGLAYAADLSVESQSQHYVEPENRIDIEGNVKVKYDDINVLSPKAKVMIDPASGKVDKVEFLDNAYSYQIGSDKKHEIKAKILEVSLLNKVFKAKERTQSTVMKNKKPAIIVTADYQEYDNIKNIMKAKGGVIIYYQDSNAFADYAQVDLDKNNEVKQLILSGHAKVTKNDSTVIADKFVHNAKTEVTTATGSVYSDINEDKTKIKVWSNFQQIDQKSNIITASGNAKIIYKDFTATGPKATVYPDKYGKMNEVVFLGRSKITTSEGRSVEADRINMTMNPKDFKADGNVKTLIPNVNSNSQNNNI